MASRRSSRKPIVSDIWVTNSSPVITLAKAGYLELLTQLPGEFLLPEAVALHGAARRRGRTIMCQGLWRAVARHLGSGLAGQAARHRPGRRHRHQRVAKG